MARQQNRKTFETENAVRAVLAGRGVTARSLIDLIHEVNPTDRGFAPDEEKRRYALKSQLQSELVRRFGDELAVVPEADPAVALLRHRHLGVDACHVRLDALDDEARSWARLRLDLREDGPAAAAAGSRRRRAAGGDQGGDPLEAARAALEEYDFEAARGLLSEAVRESGGRGEAPLMLLELLVDTLASDAEALEAGRAFAPEVLEWPEVRLLLAIAAARCGLGERARELARGLESPRAAEVWALLAAGALRLGDDAQVEALLDEAERLSPGLPQAADLRKELARRRDDRLRPMSESLARAFEAGELETAERLARELLTHCSEHRQAGRVLRAIETQRRDRLAQERLGDCERALAEQQLSLAATLLAQAAELGAETGELPARLSSLQAAARDRARRGRIGAVEALFAAGEEERGVVAWLELDPDGRAEVLGRVRFEPLAWLEELGTPANPARARPLVDAVLTLEAARRAFLEERPEVLEAKLLGCQKQLGDLKAWQRLLSEVRARVLERQRAGAAVLLEQCSAALSLGRRDEAATLLGRLEAIPDETGLAATIAQLRAEFALQARLQRLEALAARDTGGPALFEARRAAEQLASELSGAGRERWAARGEELTGRIQREFRVRIDDTERDPRIADLGEQLAKNQQAPGLWIDDAGSCAMLVSGFGHWIFVREFSLATGRVRRQVSLRVPAQVGQVDWQLDGETLWVSLQSGWLLELGWKNWRVLGWHRVTEAGPLMTNERIVVAPGSRTVWVGLARAFGTATVCDLDGQRGPRDVVRKAILRCLPACPDAAIAADMSTNGYKLFTGNGNLAATQLSFGSGRRIVSVAVHPRGDGMLAMVTDKVNIGVPQHGRLWLADPSAPEAERMRELTREGAESGEFLPLLCTSLEARCCFALLLRCEPRPRAVVAWGWRDGSLQELYEVDVPDDAMLMVDSKSRRVAVRYSIRGEQRFCVLTGQPPTFELEGSRHWVSPRPAGPDPCSMAGRWLARGEGLLEWPELQPLRSRRKQVGRLLASERLRCDARRLFALYCRLAVLDDPALAAHVAEASHELHPNDPALCVCRAEVLRDQGLWERVREVLESAGDPASLGPDAEHHYHLLGEARMRLGDRDGALEAWLEAERPDCPDLCRLAANYYIAVPQAEPLPEEEWDHGAPPLMQMKNGLLASDARLAAGDTAGAIRALERPVPITLLERQCVARLAAAWLAVEPADADARLRKTVALAAMESREDPESLLSGGEMPLPGPWDSARLTEVAARAAAWLEEHG